MPQTTIKTVNYTHMMPTRYTLDTDLRTLFTNDVLKERKLQKETSLVRQLWGTRMQQAQPALR